MSFTELTFLFIFLPCSIILYLLVAFLKREKLKKICLIVISTAFYLLSGYKTFLLFLLIIFLTYLLGNLIYLSKAGNKRKWMAVAVILLAVILAYYKLFDTVKAHLVSFFPLLNTVEKLLVPLGISFFIFEMISYIMDIYRGEAVPGTFIDLYLFASFFPKLISGPIVLWKDFQLELKIRQITVQQVSRGIDRIIVGYAKKAIIADTFGAQIRAINSGIVATGGDPQTLWLRAVLYFFEIYYDFSGYSDIAIGLSELFGFSIKDNFHYPYVSKSLTEFWRRWHISLGAWFREYVYIPLGGNRKGNVYVHLMVVFLLTGLWHGATSAFFVWGILNGLIVVFERVILRKKWYLKLPNILKRAGTLIVLFFLWLLFSSSTINDFFIALKGMFNFSTMVPLNFSWRYYLSNKIMLLLVVAVIGSFAGEIKLPSSLQQAKVKDSLIIIKRILLLILFAVDVLFIVNSSYSPFMYFQF